MEGIKDGEAIINVFNKNKEVQNEIKIIVLKEPVEKIELNEKKSKKNMVSWVCSKKE